MEEFDWKNSVDNKEEKIMLAKRIAKRVKDGEVIGFGSGSTSYQTVLEISKKIKEENLKIKAIPTSRIIEDLCNKLQIPTTTLEENKPDWCFDGADEVDLHNWLIKGMGAALYKEKLNIKNSKENYILVDHSKFVNKLGEKHPIPIECKKEKINEIEENVKKIGAVKTEIKKSNVNNTENLITDNGNYILYAWFNNIEADLEQKLLTIDGVVESGLFIGYDVIIIK